MSEDIVNTLARYRGSSVFKYIEPQYLEPLLNSKWIKASEFRKLNDPFEANPSLNEELTEGDIFDELLDSGAARKYYEQARNKGEIRPYTYDEFVDIYRTEANRGKTCLIEATQEQFGRQFWEEHMPEHFCVLCFTQDPESPPMWAHYAAEHTGVVLEFACSALFPRGKVNGPFLVQYRKKRPRLSRPVFSNKLKEEELLSISTCKDQRWAYEAEVRYLSYKPGLKEKQGLFYVPFTIGSLRTIRLGINCLISKAEVEEWVSAYKCGRTRVIKLGMHQHDYKFIES